MSSNSNDPKILNEGMIKKGGLNSQPISQRPPAPGAQNPPSNTQGNTKN